MDTSAVLPDKRSHRTSYALIAGGCILLAVAFLVGIEDNPAGIGSLLVGLFAIALGIATSGKHKPDHKLVYWAPRALCIVFALFISMFALDVFEEGKGFWDTLLALTMHLIPTMLLVAVLVISWRREWIAGTIFPLLGVVYIVWAWDKPFGHWSTFLLMAGPLFLTGVLFLLNWYQRRALRKKP